MLEKVGKIKKIYTFIHVEKCAGTSVLNALAATYGMRHVDAIPKDKDSNDFTQNDFELLLKINPFVESLSSGHSMRPYINYNVDGVTLEYYTILRNPVDRYISDYKHFSELTNFPSDFGIWLEYEDRNNFITKSIAGCDDLEMAKRILDEKFILVGFVEYFEDFIQDLSILIGKKRVSELILNTNKSSDRVILEKNNVDYDAYMEEILERNSNDIKLYEYAKNKFLKRKSTSGGLLVKNKLSVSTSLTVIEKLNLYVYRLYRSFFYKVCLGYSPLKPHSLPIYNNWRKN